MHIFYLYKITNLINQKLYIGQSISPTKRWYDHKRVAKLNPKQAINFAMQKYGIDNFIFDLIACTITQENADETEKQLIIQYNSSIDNDCGYNVGSGGFAHSIMSDATKQKLREANLGKKQSDETKRKISLAMLGKKMSEETKKKMSEIRKGKKFSKEWCNNLSKSKKGITVLTYEQYQEHSKRMSGKNNPFYGKKHTEENREKIRQSKLNKK